MEIFIGITGITLIVILFSKIDKSYREESDYRLYKSRARLLKAVRETYK